MHDDVGTMPWQPPRTPIRRTDSEGQFLPTQTDAYVGVQIRTGRRLLGWSRAMAAERFGLDVATVCDFEHGARPVPAVTLMQIAELMGKPAAWFSDRPVALPPRRAELPLPAPLAAAAAPAPAAAADRPRVLLVDDAPDLLVTVGAFLEGAGWRVIKARNGDDALRIIASDEVLHAVVTDNAMPGLSGAELLLQSAQLRPGLPGLIVTGFADAQSLADLPPSVRILRKPFRREDLVRCVQAMTQPARQVVPAQSGR